MDDFNPDPGVRLGHESMALMDHLKEAYPDGYTLGTILILADVIVDGNPVHYGCSDTRRWVQLALLERALEAAEEVIEAEAQ